jgi:cell division protein FtsI/penicillin-binding protein 2
MLTPFWQKRINVILGIFVLIGLFFGYRLFSKQVLEHGEYKAQAESQYGVTKEIPANRGKIYASDLFPLATNSRLFELLVVPRQIKSENKMEVATKLAPFVEKPAKEIFDQINNDKYYIPPLKKKIEEKEAKQIKDLKLDGVTLVSVSVRIHPEGQLASQVLGFVDASNEGRYGLESYYNDELKGIGGEIFGKKDTRGRLFDLAENLLPKNGTDFVLTLDHNIQYQAEIVLEKAVKDYDSDSGSIVIMDPPTGKILGMANFPSYNPDEYNLVPSEAQSVFNNETISSAWEPGSIFKPLIMAVAIDLGLVEPDTTEVFSNMVKVDSYEIHTSTNEAYGEETMTQVLENSDNVAMVWLSEKIGKEKMYEYIKNYGFGRKSGIELDNENAGKVDDMKNWSNTQRATIAFGQGITTTPLQMTTATNAIANKGKLMQPYIIEKAINSSDQEETTQPKEIASVISSETAAKVVGMMVSVVENGHGKKAAVEGYKVAGKTGTAQVPKPGGGYYPDRHIGSFVGFAPVSNPKFTMLVRLNNPKAVEWAESSAAPAFGEMARWLLDYFRVAPGE